MAQSKHREVPHNVLQEYLEALADGTPHRRSRLEKLLVSYAELQYRLRGGSRCALCRSSVRLVLPVKVERADGSTVEYACLCTRCLESEKAQSRKVTMTVGKGTVAYTAKKEDKPATRKFRAYGT
jgi:hypothetical protein